MWTIDTSILIESSPEAVWDVLVAFDRYEEWNPFIPRAAGEAVEGSVLELRIRPPGEEGMVHRPTVLVADPPRMLRWLGRVDTPGLFAARHDFVLEPSGEGTLVRHRERFTGLLVPVLWRTLRRTRKGFVMANAALKDRVEKERR